MSRWNLVGPSCTVDYGWNGQALYFDDEKPVKSGRCTAIAFDPFTPGKVWVGSPTGGLRVSTDGGLSWRNVPFFTGPERDIIWDPPHSSVSAIAFDRLGRIYVGTGVRFGLTESPALPGIGMLISDDGGATWLFDALSFGNFDKPIHQIIVDPTDEQHLFVATDTGLFESRDRGNLFDQVLGNPNPPRGAAYGIAYDPVDPADPSTHRLYVAFESGALVRRIGSPATGMTEAVLNDASPMLGGQRMGLLGTASVAIWPPPGTSIPSGGRRLLYVTLGTQRLFVSEDGGDTFTSSPLPRAHFNSMTFAVDPLVPETVYFGDTALLRSDDKGAAWVDVKIPGTEQLALAFDPHTNDLWAGNHDGVWLAKRTARDTFVARNRGLQWSQVASVAHHPVADGALLAAMRPGGLLRSAGHPVFMRVAPADDGAVAIESRALDPGTARRWYFAGYVNTSGSRSSRFLRSERGGLPAVDAEGRQPWLDLSKKTVFKESLQRAMLVEDPVYPGHLFFASRELLTSRNGGDDWQTFNEGRTYRFVDVTALCPASVGERKWLYQGFVDGRIRLIEWVPLHGFWFDVFPEPRQLPSSAPNGPRLPVTGFAVVPAIDEDHKDRIYVCQGDLDGRLPIDFHFPRVFRSQDGGQRWDTADGDGLHRLNAYCIVLDPAQIDRTETPEPRDRLFVGTERGVFRSEDGGNTWQPFLNGLPAAPVYDLQIHPRARVLRAALYGGSIWECPIDEVVPASVKARLHLRDVATVRRPTPDPLPATPVHEQDLWRRAADLKIEGRDFLDEDSAEETFAAPVSTTNYEPGGPLDHIGFEAIDDGQPRTKDQFKVHLQVHNRGPADARDVRVRVYWAGKSDGAFPDLDPQFWVAFAAGDAPAGAWKPIGVTQTIARVQPGEPGVVTWPWTVPEITPDRIGLLAVVSSPDDTNDETRVDLVAVLRSNEKVLLKEVSVEQTSSWWRRHGKKVLTAVGVVAAVATVTAVAVTALKRKPDADQP